MFRINRQKIANSHADYWVFVLPGFATRTTDYAFVRPEELLRRLHVAHGDASTLLVYFWVTDGDKCWLTRGLNRSQKEEIAEGTFEDQSRDMTDYLNEWNDIEAL